jgi:hypothetical protein
VSTSVRAGELQTAGAPAVSRSLRGVRAGIFAAPPGRIASSRTRSSRRGWISAKTGSSAAPASGSVVAWPPVSRCRARGAGGTICAPGRRPPRRGRRPRHRLDDHRGPTDARAGARGGAAARSAPRRRSRPQRRLCRLRVRARPGGGARGVRSRERAPRLRRRGDVANHRPRGSRHRGVGDGGAPARSSSPAASWSWAAHGSCSARTATSSTPNATSESFAWRDARSTATPSPDGGCHPGGATTGAARCRGHRPLRRPPGRRQGP